MPDDGDERTTLPVNRSTKRTLDEVLPRGASWDERLERAAELLEQDGAERVVLTNGTAIDSTGNSPNEDIDLATTDNLDGLRDDLLSQLPGRISAELDPASQSPHR